MSTYTPPGLAGPTGTTPPKKQPAAAAPPPGPAGPTSALTPILGPPSTALQPFGAYMSVQEFGQRLQAVHDAHVQQYGYAPSPTTAFHAALTTAPEQAPTLYGPPAHQQPLLAALAAHPVLSDAEFVKQLTEAAQGDAQDPNGAAFHQFLTDNASRYDALQRDKRWASKLHGITLARALRDGAANRGTVDAAGLADPGILARPLEQVFGSLIHAPGGAANLVKDIALDVAQLPQDAGRGISPGTASGDAQAPFHRTSQVVTGMARQVGQDFAHPERNAGYLFLDLLGFGSGAFSTAGRLGAAGRVAKAGEGVGATVRAFTEKPPLQTATVRLGGFDELLPLSQNPLVASVQKRVLGFRQAAADVRAVEGPSTLRSIVMKDWAESHLSFERKVGREMDARERASFDAQMALANELRVAAGSSLAHSLVLSKVPYVRTLIAKSGLTRGEQKAIQAASWDIQGGIVDKIAAEEDFHQRLIDMGVGSKRDHTRQIADLALARKAVENPSERFTRALELTQTVIDEMQQKKIEELGLAPETAEGRVARAGAFLRGEPTIEAAHLTDEALQREIADIERKLGRNATRQRELESPPLTAETAAARLAKLEAEHNTALDKIAAGTVGPIDRGEVARRNLGNARAARQSAGVDRAGRPSGASGPKAERLPTVTTERRAEAARRVEEALARNPEHPSLRRFAERADEIDRLRAGLTVMPGEQPGFLKGAKANAERANMRPLRFEESQLRTRLDEIRDEQKPIALRKQNPDAFYLPVQPRNKVKRGPSTIRGKFGASAGPYGVSPGRVLPELNHEFTGSSLLAGNYRIDATNLATEAYARTVRAITVKAQHQKLWEAAHEAKQSEWDIPVRDVNAIPDKLREVVARLDEGRFTQADAELLPTDIRALTDELYPDAHTLTGEQIRHVRWIDGRLLGELEGAPSRAAKTAAQILEGINAPFRFTTLYLRPAYALNKLGNHAMLVFDQGFLNTGVNVVKAMRLEETDGARNAATIRGIVGAGKAKSYVTSASGHVSRSVAEFWNRFADRDERVASFIYYADRKGYKTAADRDRLLNDKAHSADLNEVTRRSKKALVEFDNQTPFEKNVLRHIIFVYPWIRGSAVWSLRAVLEHPMKTQILTQLGREESQDDPLLRLAAQWYRRVGYFPVGWAAGKGGVPVPKVVNPSSINTFATIDGFLNVGQGLTVGDKTASLGDLVGPAVSTGIHVVTGRDEFGNKYPNGALMGALVEQLLQLPQLSTVGKGKPGPVAPFDIRHRGSAITHEHTLARQAVFGPAWMGLLGKMTLGGFDPRPVNVPALQARAYMEMPPEQRIKHEYQLLNWALTQQGGFLDRPVPKTVRGAVVAHREVTLAYAQFAKEHGRTATEKEKAGITITTLARDGRLEPDEAVKLQRQLKPLADIDLHTFTTKLWTEHGSGKELRQWDADVRALYSFKADTFNTNAARLFKQGLSPQRVYKLPQATLDEYGRGYLRFEADVRQVRKDIGLRKASAVDLRLLEDQHSKPVNGLPSYAAIAWAHQTPAEQHQAVLGILTRSWGHLTSTEKTLAGRTVNPELTLAWAAFDKSVVDVRKVAGSVDSLQRVKLAKLWNRQYPGFMADWLYAQRPRLERFKNSPAYKQLPHRDLFDQAVTAPATQILQAVKAAEDQGVTGSRTRAKHLWKTYVDEKLVPWLAHHPELQAALGSNETTFLEGLVTSG